MLYHVEFKSRIDGRWLPARVGHSMSYAEAEQQIEQRKLRYPETDYRVADGAYPV